MLNGCRRRISSGASPLRRCQGIVPDRRRSSGHLRPEGRRTSQDPDQVAQKNGCRPTSRSPTEASPRSWRSESGDWDISAPLFATVSIWPAGLASVATLRILRLGYPKFASLVTNEDRPQAAQEAMRWTSGSIQTKQGASVLDALDLLDRSRLDTKQSRYAKHICRNCWLRRGRARSLTATK